jgi:hypothetical protein
MNDKVKGFKYIWVNGELSMDQAVQVPEKRANPLENHYKNVKM